MRLSTIILAICLGCSLLVVAQKDIDKSESPISEYRKTIPLNARTQHGLFLTHQVGERYYFEIGKEILGKDILIVSRISRMPHNFSPWGPGVYTRHGIEHQTIKLVKSDDMILMVISDYAVVVGNPSSLQEAIARNSVETIVYQFKIEAINPMSSAFVFNVNDFFTSDISLIGIGDPEVSGVDKSRSKIEELRVFDSNVEVRHTLTYNAPNRPYSDRHNALSIELNQSFVLLPNDVMKPRLHDERMGFNWIGKIDFGSGQRESVKQGYITRWRMEPTDWDAFRDGILVEPVKPIVFYLDPSIPEIWKSYIKNGVEDWEKSFESIGFKNAVQAKEVPIRCEKNWSINDFQYSVIRFIPGLDAAAAFNVIDPRSGEILKSDIHFGQEYIGSLKKLFFVQTAATNFNARTLQLNDKITGRLIQSIISHEVGHSLGLKHNMKASFAYPLDSLRSRRFTNEHGLAPSVMDYAWGNYVAQPEDSIKNFFTRVGEFDEWAIEYGYGVTDENIDPDQERKNILNPRIKDKADGNPYREFCGISGEMDLGSDPIKASDLGIKNLKIIVNNLILWSSEPGENYKTLLSLRDVLYKQFYTCLEPCIKMIGGKYYCPKSTDEPGPVYRFIPENSQRAALKTLTEQVLKTPSWLISIDIQQRVVMGLSVNGSIRTLRAIHERVIADLLSNPITMLEDEAFNGEKAYTIFELYEDLRLAVFEELRTGEKFDIYRRTLQRIMVDQLGRNLKNPNEAFRHTDLSAVTLANLRILYDEIEKAISCQQDEISRYHLQDLLIRIDSIQSSYGG